MLIQFQQIFVLQHDKKGLEINRKFNQYQEFLMKMLSSVSKEGKYLAEELLQVKFQWSSADFGTLAVAIKGLFE